jgi:hypothetical protein
MGVTKVVKKLTKSEKELAKAEREAAKVKKTEENATKKAEKAGIRLFKEIMRNDAKKRLLDMGHNTTNDRIKTILEEMWDELGEEGRRKWITRAKSAD